MQVASRRHNRCTDILRYRCDLNRVIIRRTPHIYMSKDSAGMPSRSGNEARGIGCWRREAPGLHRHHHALEMELKLLPRTCVCSFRW